jgi:hypothetical protein
MEKKRAQTVRLDAHDWEAVNCMKEEYGITSDTDALRFALRTVLRQIKGQAVPSSLAPNKQAAVPPAHEIGAGLLALFW